MEDLFFTDWTGLLRIAVTTVIAYFLVVFMLRISGKRTLAKMNAFDFVVTIALGSILSTVILNKSTPIFEGLLAIALLILLQFFITSLTVRSKVFKKFVSSSPTLLFYNGDLLLSEMKNMRVSQDEINKSVREAGHSGFTTVNAIVMESTGDITVIGKDKDEISTDAMEDIENFKSSK